MSNSTRHRISLAYEHEGEVRQASAELNLTKASIIFSALPSIKFKVSLKWTHLSRQISSGFKLNPLLLLQPNGAAPMRPGWKDFRPGQSD